MEKITKEEIYAIVKANGLNEEQAEQILELLAKNVGGVLVDVIKLVAQKTENSFDNMIVLAGESTLRKMIDEIEVSL